MVFRKGESGNPSGQRERKLFVDALHSIISLDWMGETPELPKDGSKKVAHALAHKLVMGGLSDDLKPSDALAYIQEICDRAYGKSQASISVDHSGTVAVFTADISPIIDFLSQFAISGNGPEVSADVPDRPLLPAPIRTE